MPQRLWTGDICPLVYVIIVDHDRPIVSLLIEDGENGRIGRGGNAGDHDVLNIVVEEEPRLLEGECLREWIRISHGCSTNVAI